MLMITYYEISNDVTTREVIEAGQVLMDEGLWPPEGMDIIRWDTTVDNWGVSIAEVDDYETINRAILMWESMVPGMFEETRTAPAAPVEESMAISGALFEELPTG